MSVARQSGRTPYNYFVPAAGTLVYETAVPRDGDDIAADYGVKFTPSLMVVDGNGTVSYRRGSTELPAGQTVAQLWSDQVRAALDQAF